jgi:hypothetical protein
MRKAQNASNLFASVPRIEMPRSSFKRNSGLKTAFNSGDLVPIYVDEVLPGDTFSLDMTGFGRLATPLKPFMDDLYIDTFFFYVPYYLIWDNFYKFMGEQENPDDSTDYLTPKLSFPEGGITFGSLLDYMGIPPGIQFPDTMISALPARAIYKIYNDHFRDENFQETIPISKGDGPDDVTQYGLLKRGKKKDYFTSALPWPQKGPAVQLPLGERALVKADGATLNVPTIYTTDDNTYRKLGAASTYVNLSATQGEGWEALYADLSDATAATINDLREAFAVQRLYERDARGGTRYGEKMLNHFGVVNPDARLHRSEYLGGGHANININPIAQTSSTDANSPQGNLAGMGTTAFRHHGFTKSFSAHGLVIGLANVRAQLTYQQGIDRFWLRDTILDHYWPSLAHLSEQPIYNCEIYATDADEQNFGVFGYQERWAEYRYKNNQITGIMRSSAPTPLDQWHLSQYFTSLPVLNDTFIEENVPLPRVLAVTDEPEILFDAFFECRTARCMPLYSVPGKIDHF